MSTTTPSSEKPVPPVVLPVDLRDYFAAKAMQSLTLELYRLNNGRPEDKKAPFSDCAEAAYLMADAMLKAREQ